MGKIKYHGQGEKLCHETTELVERVRKIELRAKSEDLLPIDLELIYSGRNQLYKADDKRAVIKSFRQPNLIRRLVYTYLRQPKAKRSYDNACCLEHKRIGTAHPWGYAIEYERGLLKHSYFVSELLSDCSEIRAEMLGQAGDELFYRSFAQFVAHLHEEGVLHRDLSPGNILYRQEPDGAYRFFLVDINRMKCYPHALPKEIAYANFARLSHKVDVTERLAGYYAEYRGMDKKECVERINNASDRFFGSKVSKYARREHLKMGYPRGEFLLGYAKYRLLKALRKAIGNRNRLFLAEAKLYTRYLKRGDWRGTLARKEQYPDTPSEI